MSSKAVQHVGFLELSPAAVRESFRFSVRDHNSQVLLDGFLSNTGGKSFVDSVRALVRDTADRLKQAGTTHLERNVSPDIPSEINAIITDEFGKKGIGMRPNARLVEESGSK